MFMDTSKMLKKLNNLKSEYMKNASFIAFFCFVNKNNATKNSRYKGFNIL